MGREICLGKRVQAVMKTRRFFRKKRSVSGNFFREFRCFFRKRFNKKKSVPFLKTFIDTHFSQ